ncbi:gamma-glutamyl-gamma-aminobutyrate hydrolase family protein [Candidatus Woesearchaeota archaeon]|nr:gamma-glutamyl-gamma-aminobutyrate hydrolase family protein [Candidatus Woesearchaeota archaeon]
MSNILIIDHRSSIIKELEEALTQRGYNPETKSYKELSGIKAQDYDAIFSGGGYTKIKGNNDLENEVFLMYQAEYEKVPFMGICHGAQICSDRLGGHISEIEPRKGIFKDYEIKEQDPILEGIEIKNLKAFEWHEYGIDSVPDNYEIIITDSTGKIQMARRKGFDFYIVQFHPEAKRPKEKPATNTEPILDNFLKRVS